MLASWVKIRYIEKKRNSDRRTVERRWRSESRRKQLRYENCVRKIRQWRTRRGWPWCGRSTATADVYGSVRLNNGEPESKVRITSFPLYPFGAVQTGTTLRFREWRRKQSAASALCPRVPRQTDGGRRCTANWHRQHPNGPEPKSNSSGANRRFSHGNVHSPFRRTRRLSGF